MMSYINETDFVIENKELVYPEIVTNGLQLYYDAKGKRDTDYHRDTMLDMSGNKNHGKLYNFAYEKHSGYKDGLVFDYIDDKLVRPSLSLQPNDFTFMLNSNIISFSPDGTVKRAQDGKVVENKGINLIIDNNWKNTGYTAINKYGKYMTTRKNQAGIRTSIIQTIPTLYEEGTAIYCKVKIEPLVENLELIQYNLRGAIKQGPIHYNAASRPEKNKTYTLESVYKVQDNTGEGKTVIYIESGNASLDNIGEDTMRISEVQVISLTDTFGAGNEPTLEEIQAEPDKWQWIPNPLDLVEAKELKGNILGDIENIVDGLYKTEVLSGEEIYTDKSDDAVIHVDVDGKSYQHAGSGKNIFNFREWLDMLNRNFPINRGSLINKTESSITFKSRVTDVYTNSYLSAGLLIPVVPSKTYTFSYSTANDVAGKTYVFFHSDKPDVHSSAVTNTSEAKGRHSVTFVTPATTTSIKIRFGIVDAEKTQTYYDVQLEEGSTPTAYEPPAPTPEYPIEIHSLNDFDLVSSVGKENLLSHKNMGRYVGGNLDNYSNTNYELIGDIYYIKNNPIYSLVGFKVRNPKDFVTFSGLTSYSNIRIFYRGFDLNGNETVRQTAFSVPSGNGEFMVTRRLEEEPNTEYYNIGIGVEGSSGNGGWIKPKLSKGSKLSDWSPSPKDIIENDSHPLIDKINLLLSEALRSVEDIKDRLFRDSDGLWKIERNVGEEVFDGTEDWGIWYIRDTSGVFGLRSGNLEEPMLKTNGLIVSNMFPSINVNVGDEEGMHIGTEPRLRVRAFYERIGTTPDSTKDEKINSFKQWLSNAYTEGFPLTVVYEVESPITETLDQELQDKLNNLRSFQDSNYVYTVLPNESNILSSNLKPTLHAKFLYNNWYKEDRVINNLMIYNRALTNEEMLQNYKTIKRRWGM